MNHTLGVNTILHTKDGRKIGNGIIVQYKNGFWKIRTDYGNIVTMTIQELESTFYIAYEDLTIENAGMTCNEAQKMMSSNHKHRV